MFYRTLSPSGPLPKRRERKEERKGEIKEKRKEERKEDIKGEKKEKRKR